MLATSTAVGYRNSIRAQDIFVGNLATTRVVALAAGRCKLFSGITLLVDMCFVVSCTLLCLVLLSEFQLSISIGSVERLGVLESNKALPKANQLQRGARGIRSNRIVDSHGGSI